MSPTTVDTSGRAIAWIRSLILLFLFVGSMDAAAAPNASLSPSIEVCQLKKILSPESDAWVASGLNLTSQSVGVTPRWNAFMAPSYTVYTKPANDADVQKIVQYAADHKIPFLATGGGHGYTYTTSAVKGGIDIDLSAFNQVSIDAEKNTMTVGGSVTFADIFDPLYQAGRELPTGSCSCVGVVGATLGGGVGPYQGVRGLMLDSLLSATVVTGTGKIVTASATQNSDLFWGLRGAGMNFGIVTSATYRIYPASNGGNAYNGDFVYPASQAEEVLQLVADFQVNRPDQLSFFPSIMFDQDTLQTAVMISVIYIGPVSKGQQYMQPFIDANPIRSSVSVLPWNKLVSENRFGVDAMSCTKGGFNSVYGSNVLDFDVATYVELVNDFNTFYAENPLIVALLVTELFPNRVTQLVPDADTAFPYRSNLGYNFISFIYLDPSTVDESAKIADAFALQCRKKLLAGKPMSVYVNYAHGDEGKVAWYSARKLPKLLSLKAKWDPRNLFKFTNSFV